MSQNANKNKIHHCIVTAYQNCQVYDAVKVAEYEAVNQSSNGNENSISEHKMKPRKSVQCPYQFLNILFSYKFAADFLATGDQASHELLNSGGAGNQAPFWKKVQKDFAGPTIIKYSFLHFIGDEDGVFEEYEGIFNPGINVPHEWKKLQTMWKSINKEYREALRKFTILGHMKMTFGISVGAICICYTSRSC